MTVESWKLVKEAPRYSVSNLGRVRSVVTGTILTPRIGGSGYYNIYLRVKGRRPINRRVHRLVADAFLAPDPSRDEVNHIDGDKLNNAASNLEWVTRSENIRHALALGLYPGRRGGPIRVVETAEVFGTLRETAAALGGSHTSIRRVLIGEYDSHRGFTLEYVDEGREMCLSS